MRLPRQPDRVVLVSVMRLAARKRPMQLLAMLRAARAQLPPELRLEAKIIGSGPKRPAMAGYLRKHRNGLGGADRAAGPAGHPRGVRRRRPVPVPRHAGDRFGIAALEARCAGLPVIAFAGTGVSDFISHDRNGLLVADDAGMVEAIRALAWSPSAPGRADRARPTSGSRLRLGQRAAQLRPGLRGRLRPARRLTHAAVPAGRCARWTCRPDELPAGVLPRPPGRRGAAHRRHAGPGRRRGSPGHPGGGHRRRGRAWPASRPGRSWPPAGWPSCAPRPPRWAAPGWSN